MNMSRPYFDIEILNVASYKDSKVRILRDIYLQIDEGMFYGMFSQDALMQDMMTELLFGFLSPQYQILSGRVYLDGEDLLRMDLARRQKYVCSKIALIPPHSKAFLNPLKKVGTQLLQIIRYGAGLKMRDAKKKLLANFAMMQEEDAEFLLNQYPRQLSHGQLQRAFMALALLRDAPMVLLHDSHNVTNLVERQKNLSRFSKMKPEKMIVLMVSDDIGALEIFTKRIAFFYQGMLVEEVASDALSGTKHPYIKAVRDNMPKLIKAAIGFEAVWRRNHDRAQSAACGKR